MGLDQVGWASIHTSNSLRNPILISSCITQVKPLVIDNSWRPETELPHPILILEQGSSESSHQATKITETEPETTTTEPETTSSSFYAVALPRLNSTLDSVSVLSFGFRGVFSER